MNKGLYMIVPMGISLLVGLVANWTGATQPGLYAGATLIIGVIIYIFWARGHKNTDEPTKGAP